MIKNLRLTFLFQKYLGRTISDREYDELKGLISDKNYDAQLIRLLDEAAIDIPGEPLDPARSESIFNAILASDPDQITAKGTGRLKKWLYLAASILIIFAAGMLWSGRERSDRTVVRIIRSRPIDDHQRIRLNDGTTVVLNNNSTIEYPEKFTGPVREVTVHGEAYFDVRHMDHQPFIVHAGRLTVNVLGTAFNIRAPTGSANVEVTVTRGKVSVSGNHHLLATLLPNRQVKVSTIDLRSEELSVDAVQSISWQAKDLFFDDVTMDSAMQTLAEHFGKEILFENEQVKHCSLTGAFTHGESLEQILKVICSFNNAQFKITREGTIKVSGSGCQ